MIEFSSIKNKKASLAVGMIVVIVVFPMLCSSLDPAESRKANKINKIGIIGDSISTGAAAWPVIAYDADVLSDLFDGQITMVPSPSEREQIVAAGFSEAADQIPPKITRPPLRMFRGGASWLYLNFMNAVQKHYMDMETFSWSYMVARKLGYNPDQILLAARDGARMENAVSQLESILEMNDRYLPKDLLVLFTGNDVCNVEEKYLTSAESYEDNIRAFLAYMKKNGRVPLGGVNLWFFAAIDVLQISQKKEILEKRVTGHGDLMTCRELHKPSSNSMPAPKTRSRFNFLNNMVTSSFGGSPSLYCQSVVYGLNGMTKYQSDALISEKMSTFRNLEHYISLKHSNDQIRIRYIKDTSRLVLSAEHMAQDCFHLSLAGQLHLANTAYNGMEEAENNP